jgi:hypothetical protein
MVSHLKHEIQPTANWQRMSRELREDYEIIARAGNEVYGPGTHWIEERMAPWSATRPAHGPVASQGLLRIPDPAGPRSSTPTRAFIAT